MQTLRTAAPLWRRSKLIVSCGAVSSLIAPALANETDAAACIAVKRGSAWVCAVGVENIECGTSWHCKTLNVIPERQPNGGCACVAYSTKASDGCMATGEWKAEGMVDPKPGATVEFTLTAGEVNRLLIMDFANISDDGEVEVYHAMRNTDDFIGTFSVTFGGGPAEAIPFWITDVNLQVRSFVFRGFNTGINRVLPGADVADPAGRYNSETNEFTSLRPTHCIGYNNIFPGGYAIEIRPCMKLADDGTWDVLPVAVSEFEDCTGDFNGDRSRDLIDLAELLGTFGRSANDPDFNPDADIDGDGEITLSDFTQLMIRFGRSCL